MSLQKLLCAHARFDFHMSQEFKGGKERIHLFTCEISECGVSLNQLHIESRNVAVANSCVHVSQHSEFRLACGLWKCPQPTLVPRVDTHKGELPQIQGKPS